MLQFAIRNPQSDNTNNTCLTFAMKYSNGAAANILVMPIRRIICANKYCME